MRPVTLCISQTWRNDINGSASHKTAEFHPFFQVFKGKFIKELDGSVVVLGGSGWFRGPCSSPYAQPDLLSCTVKRLQIFLPDEFKDFSSPN